MQDFLQRFKVGHILRPSLAPTLTKVRQVELEAGDCEGRLPLLFWTLIVVLGNFNSVQVQVDHLPIACMNIGITVYPTYGGSGIVGSELGMELAKRGHTVHFISSALPTRLTELSERVRFHEVEMMSYPLFEHQPYTLALATKMATVAETENLDSTFDQRNTCARVAEAKATPASNYNSARNRHYLGWGRSLVSPNHPLRHRAVRWSYSDLSISQGSYQGKLSVR
jgi:hypothetical protein